VPCMCPGHSTSGGRCDGWVRACIPSRDMSSVLSWWLSDKRAGLAAMDEDELLLSQVSTIGTKSLWTGFCLHFSRFLQSDQIPGYGNGSRAVEKRWVGPEFVWLTSSPTVGICHSAQRDTMTAAMGVAEETTACEEHIAESSMCSNMDGARAYSFRSVPRDYCVGENYWG